MHSKDLRLGNYIQDYAGNVVQAEALQQREDIKINEGIAAASYEPIQLNAEWLIKFGFKPTGTSWLLSTDNYKDFDMQLIEESYCLNSDGLPFSNGFSYVHQLQNLYYAITNQELIIMNSRFVDQVEAIASFQYQSEDAISRIDKFILKVEALEGVDESEQAYLIEILSKLKPIILQRLQLKAITLKYM
jgi:hypothetical protein